MVSFLLTNLIPDGLIEFTHCAKGRNMILETWEVSGFKSIEKGEIDVSEITILIGKNNVGKSNVLDSLEKTQEEIKNSAKTPEFYLQNTLGKLETNKYSITLEFSLENHEVEAVKECLGGGLIELVENRGHLTKLRWMLSFDYQSPRTTEKTDELFTNWKDDWMTVDEAERIQDIGGIAREMRQILETSVKSWIFIGSFREPDDIGPTKFTEERLDRDGSNLVQKLHSLRNSSDSHIFDEIRNSYIELMEGIEDVDIKFSHETEGNSTVTIEVKEEIYSSTFKAEDISAGSKEILALLTKIHLAQENTGLLVIEEPELHLHPGAEQKIYDKIVNLVEEHDTQVLISTHSDVFVNQSDASSIIKVERPKHTVVRGIEEGELGIELADLGYSQSGLLQSDAVVLVEGLSDKLILSEWASNLGLDLDEEGISIVEIEGNIDSHGRSLVKLLYSFDIPYLFIIDSDDDEAEEVVMSYKAKINREDADDAQVWWHTTPDHFIAWEDSDIEHFLLESPEAIAAALGEDVEEIETIIDQAEAEKNVDVLERIWEEFDPDPEGVSTYEKDVHGRMIAKNMGEEELDEEVLDAMGEIQSLVSSD